MAASVCSADPRTTEPADLAQQARAVDNLLKHFSAQRVDTTEYAYLKAVALFKPGMSSAS